MKESIFTEHGEPIAGALDSMKRSSHKLSRFMKCYQPMLKGERYFTDRELSFLLHVSRRTLQEYRNEGLLSYVRIGGKVLYRESDIKELLDSHYQRAFPRK